MRRIVYFSSVRTLSDVLRARATSDGDRVALDFEERSFTFGDVRSAFVGHQLCSGGTKWLHALNFTDLDESYHPTAAGQSGGYLPVLTTDAG